jgi:hypothetical protein
VDDSHKVFLEKLADAAGPSLRELGFSAKEAARNAVLAALRGVETAFASRTLDGLTKFCAHCAPAEHLEYLRTTPRDDLSAETMFDVVASISVTFGTAEDCPYFAPRFCADGLGAPAYDIPLAFQRLRLTFRDWPTHEREAIQNFLLAQWNYVLLTEPTASIYETGGQSLNETCGILECLALVDSLSPALDIWTSSHARSADLRILEFFENPSSSWGGFSSEDYQLIASG